MHNLGVVNSFVWYIISVIAAPHCLALVETEQVPKDLWPLDWFVVCVDGCIDTTD